MHIQPVSSCPSWCDPRLCSTSQSNLFHQATPIEFAATADDRRIAVGLERLDEINHGTLVSTGEVTVLLTIEDTASACRCGHDRVMDMALSPADARFLMASIGVAVDRLETLLAASR